MSRIIDQINFFHSLKLNPTSKEVEIIWQKAIESDLIALYGIHDCCVRIEKIKYIIKDIPSCTTNEKSEKSVEIVSTSCKLKKERKAKKTFRSRKPNKKIEKCVKTVTSTRVLRPRKKKCV